jgi:hypothetical protein
MQHRRDHGKPLNVDLMKLLASLILCSAIGLLAAGTAEAQQAQPEASSSAAPHQDAPARPHKRVKATASKKAKMPTQPGASAAHETFPCPRAAWKDDPVCADAPDEHTLPTPSSHTAASQQHDAAPKLHAPGADNLSVGVDWQANSDPRLPGYDSIPMLDSVRKNIPDATVSNPGSRMGVGLGLQF